MDLSGFNSANGFGGNLNASAPAVANTATQTSPRSSGILSRLVGGITQAPSYFLHADIINPGRELAATFSGNKQAFRNAYRAQEQTLGSTPGQALKRLAGNTAQLGAMVAAPEAKAGLVSKAVQGAKIGATAGAGSAAANDQNILKGAGEGALVGGVTAPVASSILSKVLPKGTVAGATSKGNSLTNRVAADLKNHFQQAEASAGGFNAGAKLPGAAPEGISLAESQRLTGLADKHGIPAGSPVTRIGAIQSKLSDAVQHMHNVIADNNVPIKAADRQQIVDEFNSRVASEPNANELQAAAHNVTSHFKNGGEAPVSVGGQQLSSAEAQKLGINTAKGSSVKDLQSLNSYRQKLDSAINFSRSNATPDPIKEQAYNLLRQTISDHINNMAPEVSAANKTYSELKALEAPTLQENNKLANTSGSLYNRLLNNNIAKGAESKVANTGRRVLSNVDTSARSRPIAPSGAMLPMRNTGQPGILDKLTTPQGISQGAQVATAGVAGATSNGPQQSQQLQSQTLPGLQATSAQQGTNSDIMGNNNDVLGFSGASRGSTNTSDANNPFSEQNIQAAILNDIQTTGGKNVSALTSLYNTFGKQSAKQSTTEQNSVDSLHSALATLQAYNDQLNAAGGGQSGIGRLKEDVGNIPLLGNIGNASATKAVGSQSVDVATSIAKALTGGKPSSAQIKSWEKSIPLPTDTAAVAQAKMNNITESIQAKLQSLGEQ